MLKLIKSDPYFYRDEPSIRIIDTVDRSGLIKAAADSQIINYVSQIKPEAGKIFLHILAMGAGDFYGANRNADFFPENNLRDHYKTFETSPAHIFRGHVNKNPEIAIGQVVFAIYNEKMHRVELICWIDTVKGRDIVQRIEAGDYPSMSMACRTPYDVCSICGNKAHTRQEYCDHLNEELGNLYPDGRRVMALNVAPLRFFDQSIVVRPADVTSSVLQKVAYANEPVVGSAELAEIEGLTEKTATFKKLSTFVKEITGVVVDADPSLDVLLNKIKDPHKNTIEVLRNYDLHQTLCTLAHLGISPSLAWLGELIAQKTLGKQGEGLGALIEGYINEVGIEGLPIAEKDFGESTGSNQAIVSVLMPSVKQASLLPEYVSGRVFHDGHGDFIEGTNVGYAGNGPHIEETAYERFRRENLVPQEKTTGGLVHMIKTLMVIGGAALAAKWYITQVMAEKARENQAYSERPVKIGLVEKRAGDYRSTYHIAENVMIRLIKKR